MPSFDSQASRHGSRPCVPYCITSGTRDIVTTAVSTETLVTAYKGVLLKVLNLETMALLDNTALLLSIGFIVLAVIGGALFGRGDSDGSNGLPLPPGPKGKFIVGNVNDIPPQHAWLTYTEWSKQYSSMSRNCPFIPVHQCVILGDILYLRVFRQHIVILNSVKVATELLERRSRIYSDRPPTPMAGLRERWPIVCELSLQKLMRSTIESVGISVLV